MIYDIVDVKAPFFGIIIASAIGSPALAQENGNAIIESEIVVTAQRREQSLQDVSAAISVLDGNYLAEKQIASIQDLGSNIPSVSVGHEFSQAKIFIRGIGLDSSFTGIDPSVALHVDGAVVAQSFGQLGSFFDLTRIEVLRGPQGALYGRNATGGSINLITNKPTDELSGYFQATFGNYNTLNSEGAFSGPILGDHVLGRVAFRLENRSGFGENIVSGKDINDASKQSIRGHLQFNLSPAVEFLLSAEWHNEDDAALGLNFVEPLFANPINPDLVALGIGGHAPGQRDVASDADYLNDSNTWSVTGTLNVGFGDRLSLKSITNYRELDSRLVQDLDASSIVTASVQDLNTRSQQFSEEIQLTYDDDRLHGLVGLFYFNENVQSDNQIGLNPANGQTRVNFQGQLDIDAFAAFANVSLDLGEKLSVNLGGRFSSETRRLFDNATILPLIPLTLPFNDREKFEDFSGRFGIEYIPVENVLLFATFSQGFKAGVGLTGFRNPITKPEKINNYEVGFKGSFADGKIILNTSAFYYDLQDLQVGRTIPLGVAGFTTVVENAEGSSGKGVDLEISIKPIENFRLRGIVGYLDAKFDNFITGDPLTLDTNPMLDQVDLKGNQLVQAPQFTWSLGADYDLFLQNEAKLTLSSDISGKSRIFFTPFNETRLSQAPTVFLNASIKYTGANERLSVILWARNLTDETAYQSLFAVSTGRSIQGTLAAPRTYGISAGIKF